MSWDTPSAFGQQALFMALNPPRPQPLEVGRTHQVSSDELEDAHHRVNEAINTLLRSNGLSKNQAENLAYDLQEASALIYRSLP